VQREDIERMFKEVTEKFGRLDVLVNNAVSGWGQQEWEWGRTGVQGGQEQGRGQHWNRAARWSTTQ
jgi:NAD(P)-dependent dehydrogenase (short-subunit alcohol dehydrogenase family)